MKLENYRLDWNIILKKEIDYLSKKYSDIDIRGSYTNIIDLLNNNKIKSKIILSKKDLAGYAYIMDSQDKSDRMYADVGFISEKFITEERVKVFFDWLVEIAANSKKKLMLNEVYNSNAISEKIISDYGFKKVVRRRMVLDLNNYQYNQNEIKYPTENTRDINLPLYADAEYESFKYTSDKILFSSSRDDRINSVKSLFNGDYGEILKDASLIIKNKGRIIGGIVSSRLGFDKSFIVSVFVKREYRKKGLGYFLVTSSLNRLKALSYHYTYLWVNSENFAIDLYKKIGFVFEEYPDEIIYYLEKNIKPGKNI